MDKYLNVFREDLRRSLFSKQFIVAIVGIFLVFFLSSVGYISEKNYDVLFFFKMTLDIGVFILILPIFCALPYSDSVYNELLHSNFKYQFVRSNIKIYGSSKISVCIISSFLAMVIGISLFIMVMRIRYPLVNTQDIYYEIYSVDDVYGFLLGQHNNIYFAIFIFFLGISSSVFSLTGILCSLYFPYKMTIIMAPFIIFFIFNEIGAWLRLPFLRISYLMYGKDIFGNPLVNIIYTTLVFVVINTLIGKCFLKKLKRKIKNAEC